MIVGACVNITIIAAGNGDDYFTITHDNLLADYICLSESASSN